jgi:lysine/ornithine N-monooxygenase
MRDSTMPQNRRQNGSGSTMSTCLVCRAEYAKYRRWQTFCSPRCRKTAWVISHRTGTYTDVRNDIAAIKADMARVVHHLGIGKGES